jgi:hypothetical protein
MRTSNAKRSNQHAARLAKGGTIKMFGKQAAGPDKPGNTGKDQSAAPGARAAKGGTTKMAAFTPARQARPSRTAR